MSFASQAMAVSQGFVSAMNAKKGAQKESLFVGLGIGYADQGVGDEMFNVAVYRAHDDISRNLFSDMTYKSNETEGWTYGYFGVSSETAFSERACYQVVYDTAVVGDSPREYAVVKLINWNQERNDAADKRCVLTEPIARKSAVYGRYKKLPEIVKMNNLKFQVGYARQLDEKMAVAAASTLSRSRLKNDVLKYLQARCADQMDPDDGEGLLLDGRVEGILKMAIDQAVAYAKPMVKNVKAEKELFSAYVAYALNFAGTYDIFAKVRSSFTDEDRSRYNLDGFDELMDCLKP